MQPQGKTTFQVTPEMAGDEDIPLMDGEQNQSASDEYIRQRKIAQQACDLGRNLLKQSNYLQASKQFSKSVMTFEFILKNNPRMKDFKGQITSMMKQIILPSYSNLSLCYTKLQNWSLVITTANQVIQSYPDNVKNLYRRGVARKMKKDYDNAMDDFEKVMKYDKDMTWQCNNQIKQCKELRKQLRKKDKQIAKSLISGYAEDKPQPDPEAVNKSKINLQTPDIQWPEMQQQSWWSRCLTCIKNICPKIFQKNNKTE